MRLGSFDVRNKLIIIPRKKQTYFYGVIIFLTILLIRQFVEIKYLKGQLEMCTNTKGLIR
jgi:hypothetical protein